VPTNRKILSLACGCGIPRDDPDLSCGPHVRVDLLEEQLDHREFGAAYAEWASSLDAIIHIYFSHKKRFRSSKYEKRSTFPLDADFLAGERHSAHCCRISCAPAAPSTLAGVGFALRLARLRLRRPLRRGFLRFSFNCHVHLGIRL
jgi:hypothetical protein